MTSKNDHNIEWVGIYTFFTGKMGYAPLLKCITCGKYSLTGNNYFIMTKQNFHIPSISYFPENQPKKELVSP